YLPRFDKVPLEKVAVADRKFPATWITADRSDVTDEFVRYARPLIGEDPVTLPMVNGLPRMAQLSPIFAEKKLAAYIPQSDRK
ncbi:MAG: 6-phosphofructokinase, partial [Planctomycetia bacterium]|nr:6-phosphofructokinase [Planctomycetia bacterium]